jgi:hypothetical protein
MTRGKGTNLLEFSFVLQLSTAYSNASNLIDMFLLKACTREHSERADLLSHFASSEFRFQIKV